MAERPVVGDSEHSVNGIVEERSQSGGTTIVSRIDDEHAGRVRAERRRQGLSIGPRAVMPEGPCSAAVAVLLDNVIATWGCVGASAEACAAVLRMCYRAEAKAQQQTTREEAGHGTI